MSFITPPPSPPAGPAVNFPPAFAVPFGNATGTNLTNSNPADLTQRFAFAENLSGANQLLEVPSVQVNGTSPSIRFSQQGNATIGGNAVGINAASNAGSLTVVAQNNIGTGSGGQLTLRGGSSIGSFGGNIVIQGGGSQTGVAGSLFLTGGTAPTGTAGSVEVTLPIGTVGTNRFSVRGVSPTFRPFIVEQISSGVFNMSFFNATPVPRQTGVAVDIAAVHAALVAYGLITL